MKPSTKEFIVSALFMIGTVLGALILGILVGLGIFKVYESFRPSEAAQEEETTVEVYKAVREETAVYQALEEYTEGEGEPPVWWNPDEPMAVEWEDESYHQVTETNSDNSFVDSDKFLTSFQQINAQQSDSNTIQRTDIGCSDPWFDSPIYGWDGRIITQSELDLFARCFMREFWGTSLPCCEAGCDAMLNLWSTGLYGDTLFECLSAQNEQGGYIYSVYPTIWEGYYDPDGLAWCKKFVLERFLNGPEWGCVYFRLGWYHSTDWCTPLYAIDNVFFSGEKDG